MFKPTKAAFATALAGIMLFNSANITYAAPEGQGTPSGSVVSFQSPDNHAQQSSGDSGQAPAGSSSGVILAGQTRQTEDEGGPGATASGDSSGVITAPGGGQAVDSGAPEGTVSPDGNAAPGEGTSPADGTAPGGGTSPADGTAPEGTTPGQESTGLTDQVEGELSPEQAAQLEAEQAAAQEEASHLNNPLTVPDREPRLQTTLLLNGSQAWSGAFVNDQEMYVDGQSFCSISTFIENIHGNVLYRTYSSANGWSEWAMNGQQTTIRGGWVPVEAVQYRFAGPVANKYDIYYSTILDDGSRTGWAKNGETAGTMNTGNYLTGLRLAFFVKGTADASGIDRERILVSAHPDGVQIIDGALRYIHGDGSPFTGWGWSGEDGSDRYYFVDSVPVTGWQYIDGYKFYFQEDGRLLTDVEPIIGGDGPFTIRINKEMNCMTIYAKDGDNGFIIPVKSFLTSVGDDTPTGTFRTPEKYRWRLMIHDVYTQYATRLGAGLPFLMHSIIYDAPNPYSVWASTYNNMGIARSAGCIRLVTGDSKWVYDHCPIGTTVVVYNSPVPGPFDRPTIAAEIPFEQTWDPTDPNVTEEGIAAETARIIAKFNP